MGLGDTSLGFCHSKMYLNIHIDLPSVASSSSNILWWHVWCIHPSPNHSGMYNHHLWSWPYAHGVRWWLCRGPAFAPEAEAAYKETDSWSIRLSMRTSQKEKGRGSVFRLQGTVSFNRLETAWLPHAANLFFRNGNRKKGVCAKDIYLSHFH